MFKSSLWEHLSSRPICMTSMVYLLGYCLLILLCYNKRQIRGSFAQEEKRRTNMPCMVCCGEGRIEDVNIVISGEECSNSKFNHGPCRGCVELGEIDVQLAQARAVLSNLYRKHCDAKLRRNQYHDQLVRRLPVEVVSRIFVNCLPPECPPCIPQYDAYADQETRPQRKKLTPLVLAAVCQRWRQIAFANPRLWTVASIKIGKRDVEVYAQMTREWLRRSGSLLLSLQIYEKRPRRRFMADISQRPADVDYTPILEAVNAHMHRVRSLEVHFDMKYLPFLRGEARTIRDLYLSITGGQGSTTVSFNLADNPPSPQRVLLRNVSYGAISINWARVTHFETLSFPLAECLELLRHSPMLEECKIDHISGGSDVPPAPQQINLPSLKILILDQVPGQREFLSLLVAPSLETLSSRASLHILSSFITRSNCELHCLHVDAGHGTPEDFIALLEKTPYLIKLHAWACQIKETFFEHLAAMSLTKGDTPVSEAFLPFLSMLSLSGSPYFKWASVPLIFSSKDKGGDFVPRPLSFLQIGLFLFPEGSEESLGQTPDVIDADVKEHLQALQVDGKEIRIATGTNYSSML